MTGLLLTVNNDRSLDFVADSDFHFYVNPSTGPTGRQACLASPPLFLFCLCLCCYWGGAFWCRLGCCPAAILVLASAPGQIQAW